MLYLTLQFCDRLYFLSRRLFIGQPIGTYIGTYIFVKFGRRAASAFNMALFGFQVIVLLVRGPHCNRYTWFGYEGGLEHRKSMVDERKRLEEEKSLESSLPSEKL